MDISVSQLNRRLALQLPAQLPLGLVFVSGTVGFIRVMESNVDGRSDKVVFTLEEERYQIQCRLDQEEAERINLQEGDRVRVGGHLVFDNYEIAYYLLARDIELEDSILGDDPLDEDLRQFLADNKELTAVLTGVKRRSEAASNVPEELPIWVQKIAPPEVQAQLSADSETAVGAPEFATKPEDIQLNDDALTFLSEAMDSDEEIVLTPDVLAQWVSEITDSEVDLSDLSDVDPYDLVEDKVPDTRSEEMVDELPTSIEPQTKQLANRKDTDWLAIILIVVFIVLAISVLILTFVLALR